MNYLAHAHLAYLSGTSIVGNLLGDFVRGNLVNLPYEDDILNGIRLHRDIDTFTDKHPVTMHYKSSLAELRRYGGIIVDVFYDHALAKQFTLHTESKPLTLNDFCQLVYNDLADKPEHCPERFHRVTDSMASMNWLAGYEQTQNIKRALQGIATRLSKPVDLTIGLDWYQQHQVRFDRDFAEFYSELIEFTLSKC